MPNTNHLVDMQCPSCGSAGPFEISARAWFTVQDSETVCNDNDVEWAEDSDVRCPGCSWTGTAHEAKRWSAEEVVMRIWTLLYAQDDGSIDPTGERSVEELFDEIRAAVHHYKEKPKT